MAKHSDINFNPEPPADATDTHPAYGMARISRVMSTNPQPFYGSDIKHSSCIRLEVNAGAYEYGRFGATYGGARATDLNKTHITLEFSPLNFAALIMDTSASSTPCNVVRLRGQSIPPPPPPRLSAPTALADHLANVAETNAQHIAKIQQQLTENLPTSVNKSARALVDDAFAALRRVLVSNLEYAGTIAAEQLNAAKMDAQADVTLFAHTHANAAPGVSRGVQLVLDANALDSTQEDT